METAVSKPELLEISLELIDEDPSQPRTDFDSVADAELAANVEVHDVIEPPHVYRHLNRYILISGTRRVRALRHAGKTKARVYVFPERPSPADLYLHQLILNSHRLELNPMELCVAYQKIMELRQSNATGIAQLVSKSKTYVSNVLSLSSLPKEFQQLIREKRLGLANAAMLARLKPDAQQQMLEQLRNGTKLQRDQLQDQSTKKPKEKTKRVTFELPEATLNVNGKAKLGLMELSKLLQSLARECKKAHQQKLDVSTLACILRDRIAATQEVKPNDMEVE